MEIKIISIATAFLLLCYRLFKAYDSYKDQRKSKSKADRRVRATHTMYPITNTYGIALSIPMEKVTDLNDEAVLQLQNEDKDLYLIVINESSEEFKEAQTTYGSYQNKLSLLDNYRDIQLSSFRLQMKVQHEEAIPTYLVNSGIIGIQFDAQVAGVPFPISYYTLFIEKANQLFFTVIWTPIGLKEENKNDILNIIKSFK